MPNSSNVIAGANAQAADYNNLRKDLLLGIKQLNADTDGATITFDFGNVAKGNVRTVTLGGDRTLAVSGLIAGQVFILIFKQDATPPRKPIWFVSPGAGNHAIIWQNATVPVFTNIANRYDIFAFIYDGVDIFGSIVGQNYG